MPCARILTTPLLGGNARHQCDNATFAGIESAVGMITTTRCFFHDPPLMSRATVWSGWALCLPLKSWMVSSGFAMLCLSNHLKWHLDIRRHLTCLLYTSDAADE